MGFNFFEPLTQFCGLLRKTTPFLCLFGTVNINKAVLPDTKRYFRLALLFQTLFEGIIVLP